MILLHVHIFPAKWVKCILLILTMYICDVFFPVVFHRWWPSEVVSPEDIPDNILVKKPGDCMFVVRFCGSREFCWTYHGRAIPYSEETESVDGIRVSKKVKALDKYQTGTL